MLKSVLRPPLVARRCEPASHSLIDYPSKRLCHSTSSRRALSTQSSVNADEIAHFSRLSQFWWDERGEFALIHRMNLTRMQFIREKLLESRFDDGYEESQSPVGAQILSGKDVLDVGCGGGLLSESLTRIGARTTGIDASAENIAIASTHANSDPFLRDLTYRHTTAEILVQEGQQYEVVCSMEVVEHVENPASFLRSCTALVKPGGHIFLSTVARTPLSYFLTIFAAEKVLRMVTPGTHTYSKFINPAEIIEFFRDMGWISDLYNGSPSRVEAEVRGMGYMPWKGEWILFPRGAPLSTQCNYLFWARKPPSNG